MLKRLRRKAAEALAASDRAQDYLEENARVRQLAEERYNKILELEESLREANQLIAELEADALPEKSPGTITARALNAYAAEKARAEAALARS